MTLLSPILPACVVGQETLHEIPSWFPNAYWKTSSQWCQAPGRHRWWEHGAVLMFCTPQTVVLLLNPGQGLRLPQEPPKSFVPALPLQLCSNHFPAPPMVLVHPVTLQKGRGRTFSVNTEYSSWPYKICTARNTCRPLWSLGLSCNLVLKRQISVIWKWLVNLMRAGTETIRPGFSEEPRVNSAASKVSANHCLQQIWIVTLAQFNK